jgi:hypothetical protein
MDQTTHPPCQIFPLTVRVTAVWRQHTYLSILRDLSVGELHRAGECPVARLYGDDHEG